MYLNLNLNLNVITVCILSTGKTSDAISVNFLNQSSIHFLPPRYYDIVSTYTVSSNA